MSPWVFIVTGIIPLTIGGLLYAYGSSKFAIVIGSILLTTIGGLLCAYGWYKLAERDPILSAECTIIDKSAPCTLNCVVKNSGRGESRDILLSFEKMLPLETKLIGSPETGVKIEESQTLPNPIVEPTSATLLTAFSVSIPRIAANDSVSFQITTTHPINRTAGKEVLVIHDEIVSIMTALLEELSKKDLIDTKDYNIKAAEVALSKLENFYKPGKLSYEKGRNKIKFITEEEIKAWDEIRNLWFAHQPLGGKILKGRPSFKAPKVLIKTDEGEGHYAILPPYVSSPYDGKVSDKLLKEIREKGLDVIFIDKESLAKQQTGGAWKKPNPDKQALIEEHNAVAKSYEDKHLYFVPLMQKPEFSLLPSPLRNIFHNKPIKFHEVEGGVIVSLYDKVKFAPDKQEWIDSNKGYWVFDNPEFRRWQKDFHKRLRDLDKKSPSE